MDVDARLTVRGFGHHARHVRNFETLEPMRQTLHGQGVHFCESAACTLRWTRLGWQNLSALAVTPARLHAQDGGHQASISSAVF
jgi:hypothetical protein